MLTELLYGIALTNPSVFRRLVRPLLYSQCGGDPEKVHETAIRLLREHQNDIESVSSRFDFPNLRLSILGKDRMPFGTAAGFDKDGEALYPLSLIFGFEEPGSVVLLQREGNPRPRVAVDNKRKESYNAQGFPSKGASAFVSNIKRYWGSKGEAPLFVSICGVPRSPDLNEDTCSEMGTLVEMIGPYADGFVWNPFSPNTKALELLRTKEIFQRTAELLRSRAGQKLKLVKMGAYDDLSESQSQWLGLLDAWMEGGGDGVVSVNAYQVPREQVPSDRWGYPSAGRGGRFLHEYMERAVRDARRRCPDSLIVATGGIDSGFEAMRAFEAGADLIEGFTPYTFEGFGLLIRIARETEGLLQKRGYASLSEFLERRAGGGQRLNRQVM